MILYNFFICLLNPYLLILLCFSFLYTFKRHFFIILFIVYLFELLFFRMLVAVLAAITTPLVSMVLRARDIDAFVLLDLRQLIVKKVRGKNRIF